VIKKKREYEGKQMQGVFEEKIWGSVGGKYEHMESKRWGPGGGEKRNNLVFKRVLVRGGRFIKVIRK